MRYITLDDKVFEAESLEDLAQALWQSKFIPEPTLEEWMQGSASRAKNYNGETLRTDAIENHMLDMIAAGFIRLLEEGKMPNDFKAELRSCGLKQADFIRIVNHLSDGNLAATTTYRWGKESTQTPPVAMALVKLLQRMDPDAVSQLALEARIALKADVTPDK